MYRRSRDYPSKKFLDKIPAQDLDQLAQDLDQLAQDLAQFAQDLPKILPKVPRLCRPISGQDLGQDLTQDMARSQPPGKILASCQDLALLGKNLAQELFAGYTICALFISQSLITRSQFIYGYRKGEGVLHANSTKHRQILRNVSMLHCQLYTFRYTETPFRSSHTFFSPHNKRVLLFYE